jgi:signal transduction histidine kinase
VLLKLIPEVRINQWTLRWKTLAFISLILLTLFTLFYVSSQLFLIQGYEQIEQQDTEQNIRRALNALSGEIDALHTTTSDWAHWDDTYSFIQNANEAYQVSNTLDATFSTNGINFMLFINTAGEAVYSKGYDLVNQQTVPISAHLAQHLDGDDPLLDHTSPTGDLNIDGIGGILSLPEGVVLIASTPILPSDLDGPPLGSLIWGRYLDATEIAYLADETQLSIHIQRLDDPALSLDLQTAYQSLSTNSTPSFVQPLNEQTVAGYTLLNDIYNLPALIIRVEMPRVIHAQGQVSISYFVLFFLIIGLIISLAILYFLEHTILSRLIKVSDSVTNISATNNLSIAIPVDGNDELARLARSIQEMVVALDRSQKRLQSANDEMEKQVEQRTLQLSQEIIERQQAQEYLVEARDQALEALRLKTQILANVSHDARTPLSAIMLRTELFQRERYGPVTEQQHEILKTILMNGRQLLDFVNNLLTEAQLAGQQKLQLSSTEFSPAALMEEIYTLILPQAERNQLQLITELRDDVPNTLYSDPIRLRQICQNLLDNAIKFTRKGTITLSMFRVDETHWALQVADTGIGVPKEAQDRIFEAFWQIDGSITREANRGVGLGLSIVKQLVNMLGGEIHVVSELGQGSTFTVVLPLTDIKEEEIHDAARSAHH